MATTDFSFNVVPGTNKMVVYWVLAGRVSDNAVVSGELIINDISKNTDVEENGYRSFNLNNTQMRAGKIEIDGVNGIEYTVRLFVIDGAQRYVTVTKPVTPQSVAQKPEISCTPLNGAIRINISNYSSTVLDMRNGFSYITAYEVFYNNDYVELAAASELTLTCVNNGTEYEIALRAKNANGYSPFSLTKVVAPTSENQNVSDFAGTAQDTAVLLTWTKPGEMSDDSRYRISKKLATADSYDAEIDLSKMVTVPATTDPVVEEYEVDRVNYLYEGLINGSNYKFRIRVYNATTGSSIYTEISDKVPFGVPDVPVSTFTSGDKQLSIKLCKPANQNGKDVTSYMLDRYDDNLVNTTPVTPVNSALDASGCQVFLIENLTNGKQYSFNAYALNNPDSKSLAKLINATPYSAPGPVTSLEALGGDGTVSLKWLAPSNNGGAPSALSYKVSYQYISTPAQGLTPAVYTPVEVTTNDLSATLSQYLANGESTTFNVVAFFEVNSITYTSVSTPISCAPFKAPDAPVVSAVMDAQNKISYSWVTPALYGLPFEKYKYRIMLASNTMSNNIEFTDLVPNALVVTPIYYGQSHKLEIQTLTRNGELGLVESVVATTLYTPYKPPSAVQTLAVYPKEEALDVVWDPPSDFGGYTSIKYQVLVDGEQLEIIAAEKITIGGLGRGTYSISVYAIGHVNNVSGQYSSVESASGSPYTQPVAPTNFKAIPQKNESVVLSWSNNSASVDESAPTYVIFRDGDKIAEPSTLTYTDLSVKEGVSYYYKVMTRQVWVNGAVSYSDFTNEIKATPYNNPDPVGGLNVSVSDKQMTINWLAVSGAAKHGNDGAVQYNVVVSHLNNLLVKTVDNPNQEAISGTTTLTLDNLTNGREYTIEVTTKINNSEIGEDILSTVASTTTTVNTKPLAPVDVVFTANDGNINVSWYRPVSDMYTFKHYEFRVNGVVSNVYSESNNASPDPKNSFDITLANGTSNVVEIRRVGTLNSLAKEYYSDYWTSESKMPFGAPIISSAAINADKKSVDFVIIPNGAALSQIVVLCVTDKYSSADESFKNVTSGLSTSTSGSVSVPQKVTFDITSGAKMTSFFAIVINARGGTTSPSTSPSV